MYKQSLDNGNIDKYRPERILRSHKKVKLKNKFSRITKIQKSPFYRGVKLWNDLPLELQNVRKIETFKKTINRYKFKS